MGLGGSSRQVGCAHRLRTPIFNFDPRQILPQDTQSARAWRVGLAWTSSATWNLVGAIRLGGSVGDWGCRCKCQGKRTINLDLAHIKSETRATTDESPNFNVSSCVAPRNGVWWSALGNWATFPSRRCVGHRGASRFRPGWPWEQTHQAYFAPIRRLAEGLRA